MAYTAPASHQRTGDTDRRKVYLTPSGLHVEHVGCVMLQGDDLSKVHVLVEELRAKSD